MSDSQRRGHALRQQLASYVLAKARREELAALGDMVEERRAAVASGRPWMALWIALRGVAILAAAWLLAFRPNTGRRERGARVHRPPGFGLCKFASRVYGKKAYNDVVVSSIENLQHEHIEALAAGQWHEARWVLIRGYWSFWAAVVARLPVSIVRLVVQLWKLG